MKITIHMSLSPAESSNFLKGKVAALAAFAAVSAFAQSSVTLSGTIKGGVAQTKYSNGPAGTTNGSGLSVADGSSRFIIGGTEDLGGGLKAVFQIDTRFRVDDNGAAPTSSPLGSGNTFLGLSGGLGTIQLGKMDTHYCLGTDQHGSRATAQQASSCGILGFVGNAGASIANASRSTNTIRYTTPNFSGFQGQLNYSTSFNGPESLGTGGTLGDGGKGRAVNAGLNYGNGPIKAGLSIWNAKSESRIAGAVRGDQKAYTLFGNYDFGVATVGLTYDNSEINGGNVGAADAKAKRTAWSIPVTVPMGAGTFLATYTKAGDIKNNGTTAADTGASLFSVGYDYALSKRTSVGVSYARLNNKAKAGYALYTQASLNGTPNNAVGQDASQLYMGIRHAF
ncbi:porin [Polaromonas sp. SM01]|uniref:porin n=1 Tax=Polaromonas sp. SM01 TaxID=3085630 RepID=UPI002980B47E|nr:porin [Polaromonas sp. SM01]MDW5444132.1 porin [Polaromonas sp. SM01]